MHRTAMAMAALSLVAIGCRPHHATPSIADAAPMLSADAVIARDPTHVPSGTLETVIAVDNAKLAAFGLDLLRVQNALIASGTPVKPDEAGTFVVTAQREVDVIAETILSTVNGSPVRVRDVAQIQVRMKRP